jgi:diguanylate cyclase (GGDEF)-like protein
MDRARVSGEQTLSGKVSLVQDVGRGPVAGVLLYLPVYRNEVGQGEAGQTDVNTDNLLGWAYAPFSMGILMQGIQLDESQIGLGIYDGAPDSAEAQLYSSMGNSQEPGEQPSQRTERIEIAQRTWTVVFSADSRFVQPARTLALSRRYKRPFALMYSDIDRFKQVNDEYGHDVGDELLKRLASKLGACVRTSATLARQGSDEFVLTLAEISAAEDAALVAQKMFHAIREKFDDGRIQLQASLSIGIAIYDPQSSDSVEDLLRKADAAPYRVKRAGRNDFRLYQAEHEESAH